MNLQLTKLLSICALAVLTACASPAEFQNMVVTDGIDTVKSENSAWNRSITVAHVDGGEETNPLWTSEISSDAFKKALIASLKNAGLLGEDEGASNYKVRATLLEVDQPLFGLNFTVETRIRYEVIDNNTESVVFDQEVPASHTATFGDSPFAIQRLRLANEGAAKNNIAAFIEKLLDEGPTPSTTNVVVK
ncbi:MAG: hypothetical protein ACMZ66_10185 [Thalassospira sp.]|uniref:hypothetical protein n=1 Tax=Thalassospira sp. TaxID=1912094 RepID=UPI003A8B2179